MYLFLQKITTFVVILFFLSFVFIKEIQAQKFSPKVAISVQLKESDKNIANVGLIVSKDPNEYYITRSYQDPYISGVITEDTDLLFTFEKNTGLSTVAVEGATNVWVSNKNGEVLIGDPITTSTDPGIGIKADNVTAVLGYALEPVSKDNKKPILIKVQLDLKYNSNINEENGNLINKTGNTFSNLLSNIQAEASQKTSRSFLYIAVLLIIILANVFGFMIFGKIAINGITAIGRNPLARTTIIKTILVNVLMTVIFTLVSTAAALTVLRW